MEITIDDIARKPKTTKRQDVKDLIWVGIGASAGGLEALRSLVHHLPLDLPATYIVAQHMSPSHKSMLRDIVARETTMTVAEVSDRLSPQANTLYITPSNCNVIVEDDMLRLTRADSHRASPNPSINEFFTSLAYARKQQAVGIILSGTGSDGAEGVRAIHVQGGRTCAQDEQSAKYPSMPSAAVETGCVDLVIEPEELGTRFADFLSDPHSLSSKAQRTDQADEMDVLFDLLTQRTSADFRQYKHTTVQRRIERRMVAVDSPALNTYIKFIHSNPEELDALFKDLLISVTAFFRDPEQFAQLERPVIDLIERRANSAIRVWVAGCATGEEAYTLAMMLAEAAGGLQNLRGLKLQIFATDIDESAIITARQGFYSEATTNGVPRPLLERYFDRAPGGYNVRKALREKVIFSIHNIAQDPPFLNMDLISCRNLMIYFQSTLKIQVLNRFSYALASGGFLFLGKSEFINSVNSVFASASADQPNVFVRLQTPKHSPHRAAIPTPRPASRASLIPSPGVDDHQFAVIKARLASTISALGPDALLVSESMRICEAYGDLSAYTCIDTNVAFNATALSLVREPYRQDIRASVPSVIQQRIRARNAAHVDPDDSTRQVRVMVYPIDTGPDQETLALVAFQRSHREIDIASDSEDPATLRRRIKQLGDELTIARTTLQNSVQTQATSSTELHALNEEMQAANEELQSTNEEFETTNEELQSTNEELSTVNEELNVNGQELSSLNHRLQSILENISLPMLVVNRALQIISMSRAAESVFNMSVDLTLPHITRCRLPEGVPDLSRLLTQAMEEDNRINCTISEDHLNATLLIAPYLSATGDIEGAIVLLTDNTEELKRTQQELQFIFDAVPVGIIVRRRDGSIIKINQEGARFHQMDPQNLVGQNYYDQLSDEMSAELRQEDTLLLTEGRQRSDAVKQLMFRNGTSLWAHKIHESVDYPGIDDKVLFALTVDITDKHQAEATLAITEQRLERAVEASQVGLWEWTPATDALYWSQRFMDIVGVSSDNFSGQVNEFFDRVHPEDVEDVRQALEAHMDRGEPYSTGYRLRHEDGHYMWIEAHGKYNGEGDALAGRFIGTVSDITEKHQNLYSLRERNRQLDLAQRMSGVGYWRIDMHDNSLFWSDEIYAIHGVTPQEYTPDLNSGIEFYHPSDIDLVQSQLTKALEREASFEFRARLLPRTGEICHVQCLGQSIADSHGVVVAVFGVFRDVNELRAREAELKATMEELSRSNEELSRFSYVCSHDMKEPVRMIETMSELLLDPVISQDEEQRLDLVQRISRNMRRLKTTIDSLLAYSRLEARIEKVDVELDAIAADVIDNLRYVIDSKSATIDLSPLPLARGAHVHFQQLFQNLVENALKYSDSDSPLVRISGQRGEQDIQLCVEDNGPGIPPESMTDIFTVFSRLQLHTQAEGSGLGLAICHRIVTQCGGNIVCRQSQLGGAAFDIHLPTLVDSDVH